MRGGTQTFFVESRIGRGESGTDSASGGGEKITGSGPVSRGKERKKGNSCPGGQTRLKRDRSREKKVRSPGWAEASVVFREGLVEEGKFSNAKGKKSKFLSVEKAGGPRERRNDEIFE